MHRRTRRVQVKSKVQITFRGQEIEGETVNVSLLIRAPRMLPVGSSVGVSLHLNQAMKPVMGRGRWCGWSDMSRWGFIWGG